MKLDKEQIEEQVKELLGRHMENMRTQGTDADYDRVIVIDESGLVSGEQWPKNDSVPQDIWNSERIQSVLAYYGGPTPCPDEDEDRKCGCGSCLIKNQDDEEIEGRSVDELYPELGWTEDIDEFIAKCDERSGSEYDYRSR